MTVKEPVADNDLQALLARNGQVHTNLAVAQLVEQSIIRGEGQLAANGSLVAVTGKRTGRSAKDKFLVRNDVTESVVEWGAVNKPFSPERYLALRKRVIDHLQERPVFVLDAIAGADPQAQLPVRVVTEYAWHALFARQLFRRTADDDVGGVEERFTVLAAPTLLAEPGRDGTTSETAVVLDLERREILICGTRYAGEIKKSIFSVLNFLLPQRRILPMHCSANVGKDGGVALFFGLSGTGKTSLSSDADRRLIGDDEHGWGMSGVFNFEGGCYAKCIRLRREDEPQIYDAIRFGSVLENVVLDPATRVPDYDDEQLTENTRVAYPLDFVDNIVPDGRAGHPTTIFFLTADAFGVLPPIARLSPEQAMYHFLSGYTAKLAGTEVGVTDPQATFEPCFGSPFLPLPATTYAQMLREKLMEHRAQVFLLNTGWSGGRFGKGTRIKIGYTRAMVQAALDGTLGRAATYHDARFNLDVPLAVDGVPAALFHPRETWQDTAEFDRLAGVLASRFRENFKRFEEMMPELAAVGPQG
ncbi:MAG: phosphoenolpyruvate carboxykinase (ATP) [Herpetosiphon sp.]